MALGAILVASAFEAFAVAAGAEPMRDVLLALIAAAMAVAAFWG